MATYKNFEDLEVWKLSREYCKEIYDIIDTTPLKNSWKLRDQIDGASGSIMDNIAEGFERGGTKEFIQFLGFSKGSCGETRSQLYRIYDRRFIDEELFKKLINKSNQISKQLNGFITYLKQTGIKGYKFEEDQEVYITKDKSENN
ncbi:MAG: four helix bundle protein [Flavobacteriales bacterium CG18_big_fil_WC_8_21_14_2_50_32_9]|nr:four helix bundle protein [Flavobacteriales bacterium]NCT16129.1 four helix bundle protein [Flavobacteriales bacterium]PIQ16282.1 MAG: four helix bundle protein [Flavobacteriales bacterium CG18_big_fil_WC_8_21_14_2_50_32_9]PIZ06014.1 MAG: four helix bundle protein [Flavobacteriales bacterium CG_4_10_14_0_8_um_filter_32_5]PJC61841.1 MAG: four helix bundle protein [Flavobacteriales bacterium CG_4_9_14_0_2_um_filter_32_27]